jgi:hypothetical protein
MKMIRHQTKAKHLNGILALGGKVRSPLFPSHLNRLVCLAASLISLVFFGFTESPRAYPPEIFLLESALPKDIVEIEGEINDEHLTILGITLGRDRIQDVER